MINTDCSSLTHKLVHRLLNYLETQLKGPNFRTASEMTKWYTKLLENVRLRHRKLLRFFRYLLSVFLSDNRLLNVQFENSTEFSVSQENLPLLCRRLAQAG